MGRKVALVTGAGRGIGKGIAVKLAQAGYDVGVHYHTSKAMAADTVREAEAAGGRAELLQADISSMEGVASLFAQFEASFERLDVHVNNSGITRMKPFLETTPALFDEVMNTDLKGLYFCSQYAARLMVEQGIAGTIIQISSNHASGCWNHATVYAAAKAAVNKLTKNMALELAVHGIRVAGIAPGYTRIERLDAAPVQQVNRAIDSISARIPLGRFASPGEIGEAVVFLASEGAGYITGTTLEMDGGALLPVWADRG
ncbi:SDR family NAD(P)-dependent oxidoreductase [Paenibacillus sp. GCM10027626]|uniref:SDR family NAD(P)-dependent oxidoreductase n=1 Tax=Paenibacillus sp. GCM10027626 TaxID=3273411 RepID=UPI0036270985